MQVWKLTFKAPDGSVKDVEQMGRDFAQVKRVAVMDAPSGDTCVLAERLDDYAADDEKVLQAAIDRKEDKPAAKSKKK